MNNKMKRKLPKKKRSSQIKSIEIISLKNVAHIIRLNPSFHRI